MAIKIYEQFAPFANPADGDHPYGSFKNDSIPGAEDGTPLDAIWANDYAGFDAALLAEAGIVPSGQPDKLGASQRMDAMRSEFQDHAKEINRNPADGTAHNGDDINFENSKISTKINNIVSEKQSTVTAGVKYLAHRGLSSAAPENTLASFELARNVGAWGGEADIQLSSDGVWFLMHDTLVDRTTNGTGIAGDKTMAQLKALDAGSWFNQYYAGVTIPTLSEYLTLCREIGLHPMFEIKSATYTALQLSDLINEAISIFPDRQFTIEAEQTSVLNAIRDYDSTINLGYVVNDIVDASVDYCSSLGNCMLIANYPNITELDYAQSKGVQVCVYTVDDQDVNIDLISYGAQMIISNFICGRV